MPPKSQPPVDLPRIASEQAGVFTAAQAVEEGWTLRQTRRRVVAGRWRRVAGDGLALPEPSWSALQLGTAAMLTWPGCVVSHTTAAALHEWPVPLDGQAHVITWIGSHSRRGIRPHRIDLEPGEVLTSPDGLQVTDPRRTAADCLGYLPFSDALDLWAWLSTRQVLDHGDLAEIADERHQKYGVVQLRRLVEVTATGAVSRAEQLLHELLRDAGITGWEAGVATSDRLGLIGIVDLLFRDERVVIEVDGWRAHSSQEAFQRDRDRQNRLMNAGYVVLRFTWADLTERPGHVLSQIHAALAQARSRAIS